MSLAMLPISKTPVHTKMCFEELNRVETFVILSKTTLLVQNHTVQSCRDEEVEPFFDRQIK